MLSKPLWVTLNATAVALLLSACNSSDDSSFSGTGGEQSTAGNAGASGSSGAASSGGASGSSGASGQVGNGGNSGASMGGASGAGPGGDAAGEAGAGAFADCSGRDCSGHGSCSLSSGRAVCQCDDRHAGADCELCATGYRGSACDRCVGGFQDNDANGSCLPSCAEADSCSAAGSCDDSSGVRVCSCEAHTQADDCGSCSPGFGKVAGHCVWQGVIKNGHFDTKSDWDLSGGALIVGAGWSVLSASGICAGDRVSQTVSMPSYADAGPLVLKYSTRRADVFHGAPPVGVFVNGVLTPIDVGGTLDWIAHTECLGDAAYGADLTLAFGRLGPTVDCVFDGLYVDDVDIAPAAAGECPAPGSVLNGDFSAGSAGWNPPADGVSFGGSGATLNNSMCINRIALSGQVSVPSLPTLPHAALAIDYQLTGTGVSGPYELLNVTLQERSLIWLPQRASLGSVNVCLPAWARGGAANVALEFADVNGATCAESYSAKLSQVGLVSDPACTDTVLLDGGFEAQLPLNFVGLPAPPDPSPWVWQPYSYGSQPALFARNAALAHSGQGYFDVTLEASCSVYGISQTSTVPRSDATGGPALRYFQALVSAASSHISVCAGSACAKPSGPSGWQAQTLCIDPALAGQQIAVSIIADGFDGCDTPFPEEHVRFDDLELATDASCPK